LPPRIDLELEALSEVVEGKRLVHCHSYRQDEILALIRTCDAFGVQIATFQHVLEGYKVADAIAKHGAGGSSFSDWWAFKFEVFDAIPYNGSLLHNAGVVVSFNSDNAELARRLNLEAAKAVKYGGVPPEEALKFVTLNPAKQLRVDKYVGSLEVGKDADLVVWSASPLSTYSRCEQTWVDGRRYFDVDEDKKLRQEAAALRAKLVQRVLASGEPAEKPGDDEQDRWPREDIFCEHGHHGH
jgi:N-acetylglucosamine-6-phosphate deacetylase